MPMTPTEPPPARTATVVVAGDDVFEDLFTAAVALQSLLTAEGFAARTALGTAVFEDAGARIAHDDLIVLYTAAGRFTAGQRRGLAQAVHDGAGLIAVHSANLNLSGGARPGAGGDPLLDLIGSRYISHGPPPHESRFRVRLDDGHEVTAGIAPFDVTHEHYRIETAPDARILAWRRAGGEGDGDRDRDGDGDGDTGSSDEPLMHVRTHGAGRVCYLQLGHDLRIWGEPPVRRLVRRAARWACRGAVRGV